MRKCVVRVMKRIVALMVFTVSCMPAFAGLWGGQITIKKLDALNSEITLLLFTSTSSTVHNGNGVLNFGDGTSTVTPGINVEPTIYADIGTAKYVITHTYPAQGSYIVSYQERDLEAGILNLTNSVETPFYIESAFLLDDSRNYSSPVFPAVPILVCTSQRPLSLSIAPIDSLDRQYVYYKVTPKQDANNTVDGYIVPTNFAVDPYNGLVTWDTGFQNGYYDGYYEGVYLFSIRITQYDENGLWLGYVTRCFAVIVENTFSKLSIANPIADPDGKILVTENQQQTIKLILEDSTAMDSVRWDLYSDPNVRKNISFSRYDSVSASRKTEVGILTISSTASIARDYPYIISLRGSSFSSPNTYSKEINFIIFTKEIVLPVITGLPVKPEKSVTVYPNPFSNILYLDGIDSSGGTITLMNILGQNVLQSQVLPQAGIDASQLAAGAYIAQIDKNNFVTRIKIVKK
jgi:hypothetical protein